MAMPTHHPWRSMALILVLLLLFSTVLAQGAAQDSAQEPPRLQVDSSSHEVGDTVVIQGTGLDPEEEYALAITDPTGSQDELVVTSDSEGELAQEIELPSPGSWIVMLRGGELSGSLTLVVEPSESDAEANDDLAVTGEPGGDPEVDESLPEDEGVAFEVETTDPDDAQGEEAPAEDAQDDETQVAEQQAEEAQAQDAQPDEAQADETQADAQDDEQQVDEAQSDETQAEAAQDEETADDAQDEEAPAQDEDVATQPSLPDDQGPTEVEREISVEDGAVVAREGEEEIWSFGFTPESGGIGAILVGEDIVWVGVGNSLLQLDPDTGTAQRRHPMPGRVIRLERMGTGVSVVNDLGGGLRQRIEVGEQGPRSTVRFGTRLEQFEWLRNEAAVEDPAARLQQDPTNPWLHLRVALANDSAQERQEGIAEALDRAETFYDLAGIARQLQLADESEAATEAMDMALADFADRSYDPRLLDDPTLHRAYDFPLAPMERALEQADLAAADFWAPWLYLVSSSGAEESRAALTEYARQLERVGQSSSASLWRERAREGGASSPTSSLERFFLRLGSIGWYGVAALLAAILALHLTLVAKYWAPQSLAMRRRVETGGSRRPWMRVFAIRFYSFTEKVVLVLLFAACLALLGLASWHDSSAEQPAAFGSGTLASPVARDLVTSLPLEGERAAFIRGYAAHAANETSVAEEEYELAGDYPAALNNLAALSGEEALYRRALELAPALPEAAYNLGRRTNPSPFHDVYLQDEPLLAVPDEADFRTAAAGTWQRAIGATFENPWSALRGLAPLGIPSLAWQVLLALFLLWIIVTVLWLLLPRPAYARNAPRSTAYHVLALLIPGSGLADEAWGVLLMVPWALLGVDALSQWFGWERSLGLPLQTELWALAAIYVVNLIAFVVEFTSYQKRMRELRRNRPEAAEAYALRRA